MKAPKPKYRTHRYRFLTSMSAGIAVVLLLAYVGHKHHDPMPVAGGVVAAVGIGLAMFVVWSVVAMFRRAGERARARESAAARPAPGPASRRDRRRYARQG